MTPEEPALLPPRELLSEEMLRLTQERDGNASNPLSQWSFIFFAFSITFLLSFSCFGKAVHIQLEPWHFFPIPLSRLPFLSC